MSAQREKVKEFWEERGAMDQKGGTNDFVLQGIEEKALLDAMPEGSHVFDIGCGDGHALNVLHKEKGCTGVGGDYSESFIKQCKEKYENDDIKFDVLDVRTMDDSWGTFDVVTTKRCLINMENAEEQKEIFGKIIDRLKPGGLYIMIESFEDGNEKLNEVREPMGLPPMKAPWHNVYLRIDQAKAWEADFPVTLQELSHFSSTYYFLSRIVNAKMAASKGEEPRYDAEVNLVAPDLPAFGEYGATKMMIWKKDA